MSNPHPSWETGEKTQVVLRNINVSCRGERYNWSHNKGGRGDYISTTTHSNEKRVIYQFICPEEEGPAKATSTPGEKRGERKKTWCPN